MYCTPQYHAPHDRLPVMCNIWGSDSGAAEYSWHFKVSQCLCLQLLFATVLCYCGTSSNVWWIAVITPMQLCKVLCVCVVAFLEGMKILPLTRQSNIKIHLTALYLYLNNWSQQINHSHIFQDTKWNTTNAGNVWNV